MNEGTSNTEDVGNFLENYEFGGTEMEILVYPAPSLTKVAKKVEKFDSSLRSLCRNMLYSMYKAPGVGLAAPQIGQSITLFVIDCNYNREESTKGESIEYTLDNFDPEIFVNPEIVEKSGELLYEEGCLSVPGVYETVKRAEKVVVEYQDMFGNPKKLEAEGSLAVCIQHEYDHLIGKVFLDRLSLLKRKILKKKFLKGASRLD